MKGKPFCVIIRECDILLEALDIIYKDFVGGCKNITYPDGYIVDDLYEMMDM